MSNYIYLAGAIMDCPDPHTWRRAAAIECMLHGYNVFDPLLEETVGMTRGGIVKQDYSLILRSCALLVDCRAPSWGTAMELAFAHQHKIPAFGWGLASASKSHWLHYHIHSILDTPEAAIRYMGAKTA